MKADKWRESIAAVILLMFMTGCVATTPLAGPNLTRSDREAEGAPTEGFGSIADFESEYMRSAEQLASSLPPGVEFPTRVPGSWKEDAAFERGAGEMQAAFYWQCAWLTEYSSAKESNDASGQVEALDKLDAWITLPGVEPHVDEASIDVWNSEFVAPAREGRDDNLLSLLSCSSSENSSG